MQLAEMYQRFPTWYHEFEPNTGYEAEDAAYVACIEDVPLTAVAAMNNESLMLWVGIDWETDPETLAVRANELEL